MTGAAYPNLAYVYNELSRYHSEKCKNEKCNHDQCDHEEFDEVKGKSFLSILYGLPAGLQVGDGGG